MQVKTLSVILIDDDPHMRNFFDILLAYHGVSTTTFTHPRDAYTYLTSHEADVVVIDLFLDDTTAYDVLPQIRALCPHAQTIITTSLHSYEQSNEAMLHGFDAYLPKPLDIAKLTQLLRL